MVEGHGNNIYQFESGVVEYDFSSNIAFNNYADRVIMHLKGELRVLKTPRSVVYISTHKLAVLRGSRAISYWL